MTSSKKVTTMLTFKLAIYLVAVVASASTVEADCPRNIQQAQFFVNQCTLPLTGNSNFTVEGAEEFCNGTSQGVVRCVEDLLAECEGVSQGAIQAINSIVDRDHLNQTLIFGCESVSLIQADGECVDQQMNTTASCLQNELTDYAFKIRALQSEVTTRGFKWLETEQQKAVCRYTSALGACANTYLTNCNQNVYNVYHSFLTAFRVPNCDRILSQTVIGSSSREDGCPASARDAVAALSRCTLPLVPLTTFDTGLPSTSTIQAFCTTSNSETTACLKKLQECGVNHPDLRPVLTSSLDIPRLLGFLYLSCTNFNLLSSQERCVEQKAPEVNGCAQNEFGVYITEVQGFRSQAAVRGAMWFQSNLLQATCRYSEGLLSCIKPFKFGCNFTLYLIYERLIKSSRSPGCAGGALSTPAPTTTSNPLPPLVEQEFA